MAYFFDIGRGFGGNGPILGKLGVFLGVLVVRIGSGWLSEVLGFGESGIPSLEWMCITFEVEYCGEREMGL